MTWVTMLVSTSNGHVAGEKYNLDDDEADKYIIKGYAEGNLSRRYTDQEENEIRANVQSIALGKQRRSSRG